MPQNSSSKSGSDIAPLILPAAAIIVLYGMWSALMPAKIGGEIANLQKEFDNLKISNTSWLQVEQMEAEVAQASEKLTQAQQALEATQLQAQNHCGREIAAVDQLETMGSLDGVLQQQGLMITADRSLGARSRMRLAATLDSATDRLLDEIQESQVSTVKQTRYLPTNASRGATSTAPSNGNRRQSAPEIQLREVELLGTYHHMLAALDQLHQHCGNSLVIGVAVRRPETLSSADSLRLWTLQLQVRPAPQAIATEQPTQNVPLQLAAE